MSDMPQDFEAMKSRLDEIADEVSAEGISLDEALALYEEAVKLGLSACDVSEADILVPEEAEEGNEGAAEAPADDASAQEDAAAVADAVAVAEAVEASEGTVAGVTEETVIESVVPANPEENSL